MKYNLWDIEIGNYLGQFTDEDAALAIVRALVQRHGPDYADSLSLGREQDDGRCLEPLSGPELTARVAPAALRPNPDDERRPMVVGSRSSRDGGHVGLAASRATRSRRLGFGWRRGETRDAPSPRAPKRDRERHTHRDG